MSNKNKMSQLDAMLTRVPLTLTVLEKFCQNSFFSNFWRKIVDQFSAVEHYICHILGMVGPIDVKQKGDESTGCYTDPGTIDLTFDLVLWPWIFNVELYLGNGRPDCHGTKGTGVVRMPAAAAVLPTLFNFPGKPLQLISSNHTWFTYGCGKNFWHPSRWPWVKVTKLPKWDAIYLVPMIKWEQLVQSLQNFVGISALLCYLSD